VDELSLKIDIDFTFSRMENHLIPLARCKSFWMDWVQGTNWIASRTSSPWHLFLWGRLKSLVLHAAYVSLPITKLATLDIITQTSETERYSVQHHINLCERKEGHKLHFRRCCFGRMRPDLW